MTCGIYEIVHLESGKRYVGSAVNFKSRFRVHKHQLRNNTHHSKYLQRAWNKYGEASFEFRILKLCDPAFLIIEEQKEIDAGCDYNTCLIANSSLGTKASPETREKMSKRKAVLSDDQVLEIRKRCDAGEPRNSVAKSMGLNNLQVQKVANRQSYLFVEEDGVRPSLEEIMRTNLKNRGRPKIKEEKFTFCHEEHGCINETIWWFGNEFGLNKPHLMEMTKINPKRKSHKGWTLKKAP